MLLEDPWPNELINASLAFVATASAKKAKNFNKTKINKKGRYIIYINKYQLQNLLILLFVFSRSTLVIAVIYEMACALH